MTGPRLPTVRMSQVVAAQEGEEDGLEAESVVVEIPSSSKFGIAWPAEQPSPAPLPSAAEKPVMFSSSEGETDVSEEEPSAPIRRPKSDDYGEDSAFVTPTNHLNLEQNPMDQAGPLPPQRRLSRAFSMPLPSQLGSLKNPRRLSPSSGNTPVVEKTSPGFEHFRELSLELADSVQMVIQTLLQLSPPQVFDPAKEQFSACSLSIPTPSICAMFTSMKNLNYMSANMSAFSSEAQNSQGPEPYSTSVPPIATAQSDFDVGEMLQSVGDALSGVAAQAAVDLVLFHGDVGMKHIAVKGDETALSYTLSHVVRQVIGVANPGDTVEIGLFIEPLNESPSTPPSDTVEESAPRTESPSLDGEGLLRCTFHIALRYASDTDKTNGTDTPDSTHTSRPCPPFNTIILRRLLSHIGATLDPDIPLKGSFTGRACQLSVTLEAGEPSAVNPSINVSPEDAAILGYPDVHISNEPSLDQLLLFAETLRGKSVTLYASAKGSFAHHLSSYLTAWGMNVSHMSTEPDAQGEYEQWHEEFNGSSPPSDVSTSTEGASSTSPTSERHNPVDASFVLIDDDVAVLRSRLLKLKAEQVYPLNPGSLHARKRPSLAANHRPRSSPQVARVMGLTSSTPPQPPTVIVHFTSLSNFKLVKDAIQSIFTPANGFHTRIPEIIVIPKPAGPRRFLTALHTAVTRPVVDPFFVPTATSPMSPGLLSPFFNFPGAPKSPSGRSATSGRAPSDRSARSPKEFTSELSVGHAPPSPLSQSEGIEYFSDAVVKLGATPATGLLIQSPDGQPTGIFFHPKARTASGTTLPPSPKMEPTKAQDGRDTQVARHRSYRIPSAGSDRSIKESGIPSSSSAPTMRASHSNYSVASENSDVGTSTPAKGKGRTSSTSFNDDRDVPPLDADLSASRSMSPEANPSIYRGSMIRRQSSHAVPTSPPTSPQVRSPTAQTGPRRGRRMTTDHSATSPSAIPKKGKGMGASEGNIVPPISVLIVDDNPINQTILSTFMKKRRIKYDVAKNGEEAVDKWRSGTFHLILMDIQMPVMDGIQATKEIRRIEKQNAAGAFPSTPQSEGQRTPSETSTTDSRAVSTPAYRSSVIIVALTASSLQADRVAALAAGCNDFLTKPVSLEWLNSKIIEWGSIKALQMWADIRPEVVRSITTGQAAQAQQVARRLHVPEGRSAAVAGGMSSRSSSAKRTPQENADAKSVAAAERNHTATTRVESAAHSSQGLSEAANVLASVSTSLSNISAMSPSEAAMTLASAHRPQVPIADIQIPADTVVAAVESALPSLPAADTPAASAAADTNPAPLDDEEKPEEQPSPPDDEPKPEDKPPQPDDTAPPEPPQPDSQ